MNHDFLLKNLARNKMENEAFMLLTFPYNIPLKKNICV